MIIISNIIYGLTVCFFSLAIILSIFIKRHETLEEVRLRGGLVNVIIGCMMELIYYVIVPMIVVDIVLKIINK